SCLALGPGTSLGAASSWQDLCARLPADWFPDLVVFDLAYHTLPPWLGPAPVPLVALAADAQLQFHWLRRLLPRCEGVLADPRPVERLHRAGIHHARAANLFGVEQDFLAAPLPAVDAPRDIDVLFVGNWSPAVQRERLPWLGRLARLRSRWNV